MIIDAQGLSNTSAKNTSFPPHISSIFDTTHEHHNNNADTLQPILTSEKTFISFFSIRTPDYTRFNRTAQIYIYILWSLCVATLTVGRSKLCNGCNTNVNNDSLHRKSRYSKLQRRVSSKLELFLWFKIRDILLDFCFKI